MKEYPNLGGVKTSLEKVWFSPWLAGKLLESQAGAGLQLRGGQEVALCSTGCGEGISTLWQGHIGGNPPSTVKGHREALGVGVSRRYKQVALHGCSLGRGSGAQR